MSTHEVKALVFDVFGTVVDWRGSVIREVEALGRSKGVSADWGAFADQWRREGYHGGMDRVRSGELPWTGVDTLHRMKLDELLPTYGLRGLSEAEVEHFNRVWHRLDGWPDAVPGLTRLKRRFVISTLSNGTFALLTNMAKHAGLPWDCIISSELARAYKPDPKAYHTAAELLGLPRDQVMLVAAHVNDLRGAQRAGLRAAYVPRPLEHDPDHPSADPPDPSFDCVATDFLDLADQLGA